MPLDDEQIEKVFESADRNKARSDLKLDFWSKAAFVSFCMYRTTLLLHSIQLQDGKLTYEEYTKLVMLGL